MATSTGMQTLTAAQMSYRNAAEARVILQRLQRGSFTEEDKITVMGLENKKIGSCARASKIALGILAYIVGFCSKRGENALRITRACCIVQGALDHQLKIKPQLYAR